MNTNALQKIEFRARRHHVYNDNIDIFGKNFTSYTLNSIISKVSSDLSGLWVGVGGVGRGKGEKRADRIAQNPSVRIDVPHEVRGRDRPSHRAKKQRHHCTASH